MAGMNVSVSSFSCSVLCKMESCTGTLTIQHQDLIVGKIQEGGGSTLILKMVLGAGYSKVPIPSRFHDS